MTDTGMFTLIFTGIWCLVGAIFLAVGVGLRRAAQRKEDRLRARTTGTVTEVVRRYSHSDGGDTPVWYPIVEFEAEGRRISLESGDGGGRKRFYEGQRVEVLFDPDDPSCFQLEGFNSVGLVGKIFLWIGLGSIAIGLIVGLGVNAFSGGIHIK